MTRGWRDLGGVQTGRGWITLGTKEEESMTRQVERDEIVLRCKFRTDSTRTYDYLSDREYPPGTELRVEGRNGMATVTVAERLRPGEMTWASKSVIGPAEKESHRE